MMRMMAMRVVLLMTLFMIGPVTAVAATGSGSNVCVNWLKSLFSSENRTRKKMVKEGRRELQSFAIRHKYNKNAQPPMAFAKADTPQDNLFFDFSYWWFPGNIWHSVMARDFGSTGATFYQAMQTDVANLPSVNALPFSETIEFRIGLPSTIESAISSGSGFGSIGDSALGSSSLDGTGTDVGADLDGGGDLDLGSGLDSGPDFGSFD